MNILQHYSILFIFFRIKNKNGKCLQSFFIAAFTFYWQEYLSLFYDAKLSSQNLWLFSMQIFIFKTFFGHFVRWDFYCWPNLNRDVCPDFLTMFKWLTKSYILWGTRQHDKPMIRQPQMAQFRNVRKNVSQKWNQTSNIGNGLTIILFRLIMLIS